MHLVLTLPGLLAPRDRVGHAPMLARLLRASGAPAREPDGIEAALAVQFGVARQRDRPLAPIGLAAHGIDPGAAYWLRADPVTMVAGRDDVRLTGAVTDLAAADAAALVAALNAHFAADGLVFVAPRPDAWFVRAPAPPRLATRPLAAAIDRPLRALLPDGEDAGTWRRWQNEIGMLLHEHPVNVARERTGAAPVSAVWFSDGGTHPAAANAAIRTRTNGGLAAALALHAGMPAQPVPASLAPALAAARGAATLVVALDAAPDLDRLDAAWTAPAWTALSQRDLDAVTLIADGAGAAAIWMARRPNLRQRIAGRFGAPDLAALLAAARSED